MSQVVAFSTLAEHVKEASQPGTARSSAGELQTACARRSDEKHDSACQGTQACLKHVTTPNAIVLICLS